MFEGVADVANESVGFGMEFALGFGERNFAPRRRLNGRPLSGLRLGRRCTERRVNDAKEIC